MARSRVLQFRLEDDTDVARLDAEAAALGVSRSALVRMLVMQGLGDPSQMVVLREAYFRVTPVVRKALGRVLADVFERLPAILEEEMAAAGLQVSGLVAAE